MEQLQTRVAQLENEIQRRANSPPSKSPMCATPSRRPVVASTPAREPLGNITVGNNSMLQQTILAEIKYETRLPRAITRCMSVMFTPEQLATCSFKGAPTTVGTPRPGLPDAERNAIIDALASRFNLPLVEVEEKVRGALRRMWAMHRDIQC
ncbi:uncharacterized protein LOC127867108 [Dreissena polymorpha]|nr:uncharacterized protein LOC127867108 [Dreissena polymorpha]